MGRRRPLLPPRRLVGWHLWTFLADTSAMQRVKGDGGYKFNVEEGKRSVNTYINITQKGYKEQLGN